VKYLTQKVFLKEASLTLPMSIKHFKIIAMEKWITIR